MANIKMIFQGTERSETSKSELEVFANRFEEIFLCIEDNYVQSICLDKPTAVRLVRELKKQIGYINQTQS